MRDGDFFDKALCKLAEDARNKAKIIAAINELDLDSRKLTAPVMKKWLRCLGVKPGKKDKKDDILAALKGALGNSKRER